ncbi:MAG: hypothetical protein ABIR84_10395, partial [Candidatus Nitrotoga sp.]
CVVFMAGVDVSFVTHILPVMAAHLYPTSAVNHTRTVSFARGSTLIRFDQVYVGHFKCNLKRLVDYPNLWAYTRDLYHQPGVAETINMHHIKNHYYGSHTTINPNGVVPLGPVIDYHAPHSRNQQQYQP